MADRNMDALSMPRTPYVAIRINPLTNDTTKLLIDFVRVQTVQCSGCASEFSLKHYQTLVDENLGARQAGWLQRKLADDHKQKKIHSDFVYLPIEGLEQNQA